MSDQTEWPTTTGDEVHDKFLQAIHTRLGFFGTDRPAQIDYKNGDIYCGTHDDVEMIVKLEPLVAGNGQHPFKVTILKENASFIRYVIEAAAEPSVRALPSVRSRRTIPRSSTSSRTAQGTTRT